MRTIPKVGILGLIIFTLVSGGVFGVSQESEAECICWYTTKTDKSKQLKYPVMFNDENSCKTSVKNQGWDFVSCIKDTYDCWCYNKSGVKPIGGMYKSSSGLENETACITECKSAGTTIAYQSGSQGSRWNSWSSSKSSQTTCSTTAPKERGIFTRGLSGDCLGCGNCTQCDIFQVIVNITSFIFSITGALAVFFMVNTGFSFAMARGNQESIQKAKGSLAAVVVGVIIILIAWALINTALTAWLKVDTNGLGNWFFPTFSC
ncbi:hypothetical protein KJ903_02725 [Patescibacteria group bacterium]|nr:hypothetical protein [Patescibacteria group bacterium]